LSVIYLNYTGALIFEYIRSVRKEAAKEAEREAELQNVREELKDLYFAKARQETQIKELVEYSYQSPSVYLNQSP